MDFETPNGSQFSLREIWSPSDDASNKNNDEGALHFHGTLITALVEGRPYASQTPSRLEEISETDAMQNLTAVPLENVFPLFPTDSSVRTAPPLDSRQHHLKAPPFTMEDVRPGQTHVAEGVLREVEVLERLQKDRHVGIVEFLGCVVREGRITHLCLRRYAGNLVEWLNRGRAASEVERVLGQVRAVVRHLHSLDLAHNNINPENVCIDWDDNAVIVDFDLCHTFGAALVKGGFSQSGEDSPKSDPRNDLDALEELEDFAHAFAVGG